MNVISELYILDSANLTSIDAYTFNRQNIDDEKNNVYHNIETLHLPESLTEIGISAFNSIQDLTSLVIPDKVVTLGASAFNACSNLKHLSLSTTLTNIPNNCFSACGKLESLIIPSSVTHIDANAFFGCEKLSSLHLPETLIYIGQNAFCGCNQLKSLIIPSNIKTIGQNAFYNCNELTQLIFSSVENENNEDVGEQEMTISQSAFSGCGKLKKIILPKNFKTIANNTFKNCLALEELHLLSNNYYDTNSSAYDAFAEANNLKKIVISNRMLFNSSACGFNNILQSINPQNNLIVQIDGLDIKNPSLVDNEDTTYNKNISTLNGFKSSVLYTEFKNTFGEDIVKKTPYQEKDDYKCKFIDMNGVDIIDTFGSIDVSAYSEYQLNDSENIMLNKYVNIMDTVFDDVKKIVLNDNDNTWGMLSSDGRSFTLKKGDKIPQNLEYLQLSNNVTAFESGALSGSNLTEIDISDIPNLPDSLCEGCKELTLFRYNVNKCQSVGVNILKNCNKLETVIIDDFSKFMSNTGTLYGCTKLKSIQINYQKDGTGFVGWRNESGEFSLPTSALPDGEGLNVYFKNLRVVGDQIYLNDNETTEDQRNEIEENIASEITYQCFNETFTNITTSTTFKPYIKVLTMSGHEIITLNKPEA